MTTRLLGPLVLLVLWVALWGELSWANLASGAVVLGIVAWGYRRPPDSRRYRVHVLGFVRLLAVLAVDLARGSFRVAAAVLLPDERRLRDGTVSVELTTDGRFTTTVVADMLSLVPGTLALDTLGGPPRLEVHVLGLRDEQQVRDGVARIEMLVLAAFEPMDAQGRTSEGRADP
jgi:multicomponent Na+:H+ antiporter subunit E